MQRSTMNLPGLPDVPDAPDAPEAPQPAPANLPAAHPQQVKTLVWMSDVNDVIVYLSRSIAHLFELGNVLSVGMYTSFIHPDDRARVADIFDRAKAAREECQADYRVCAPDGSLRWVTGSGAPRFSADGEFLGYAGALIDVTDHYDALERLAKSEASHRMLTENSQDLISQHAANTGMFQYASPAFQRVLGYAPSELVNRISIYSHVHPDDVRVIREELQRQAERADDSRVIEFRVRHKDGHMVWMGTSVKLLVNPTTNERLGSVAVSRDITHEVQTAEKLAQLAAENKALVENSLDIIVLLDRDGRFLRVNEASLPVLGYLPEEMLGRRYADLLHADEVDRVGAVNAGLRSGQNTIRDFESRWRRKDGRYIHLSLAVRWSEENQLMYATARDVTERIEAQKRTRDSEQRFREVIEMTPAGYVLADGSATILDVNPALCAISGYAREELIGQGVARLFAYCPWLGVVTATHGPTSTHGMESVLRHKQGNEVYVLFNGSVKRDADGKAQLMTGLLTDITARKEAESRLQRLATHDTLTGLPNRTLLNERVQQMLDAGPRNMPVAIMFIDLDRFKEVNDSFGHEPGDVLLREVARRLGRALRPSDVIARLGGDEFVVAAYCSDGTVSAASIAEKLLATLASPIDIGAQEVVIGASIGISMFPEHARTKELLFQSADTAMYRAKAGGRNGYCFFAAEMTVEARTRMTLELSLRHALAREEFVLHYQPRIDLGTMAIVGMEALIRWNHPELGQVSPMQFIPIAEETGLIEAIGQWVLLEACMQTRRLMDWSGRPLCISVNLSARQLKCRDIVDQVRDALDRSGLPAPLLELELTESALIEDIEHSARLLKELKGLGIRLAVDDFGTGYSGLAYLRRFPLDVLKLDRSFVLQQDENDHNFDFIKAFVDMAHALKLSVVAEGVETSDTLQFLRNADCDEAQGYFLAKPLSLSDFEAYLSRLPRIA
ncbi:bifunctional diguanylate cyclase/phosphodiesterase [Noviherbaspirillum suwonense]|uniref:PAS domain S-box-containing protein/diguanylate cyclase (GGDEF) domain-containing protein n=1 Tax=Noviherbaspirillum suwonense TaxID=1224511 RepID=A0ABY1QL59_9BURK|nr:bifunctional diguanylate cyclase/phosphodiesterase [Noviherbaspirillum suwonense]SMP74659.1 PAS domain S-box-containing protein/diguanylate cyclase (GGDEF) domain-containing protein [Noviherbaspirillum suwonense]